MPRITVALAALALAAALAGCQATPASRQAEYERAYDQEQGDKAAADYYRSVELQRDADLRRAVREELERQAPRGARP